MSGVLVAVSDLFFSSKVDAVGIPAPRAQRGIDLAAQVREKDPARLVLELASGAFGGPALEAIRTIRAENATIEIVGFCRHTEGELIRAAKSAGADRVLTQGEFAEQLPSLLG